MAATRIAALTVAALVGAGCAGKTLEPNGKDKVFDFGPKQDTLAEGLEGDYDIPAKFELVDGCGKLDFTCERRSFAYDFSGTTLEFDAGPGLRIVGTQLLADRYRFTVACDQAQATRTSPLRVRVMADGAVRYTDALDVGCMRTTNIELHPPAPHTLVGVRARVPYTLTSRPPQTEHDHLDGRGLVLSGPFKLDDLGKSQASGFYADATAVGGGAKLRVGSLEVDLGMDVIGDDAAWTIAAKIDSAPSDPLHLSVKATAPDGLAIALPAEECLYTFAPTGGKSRIVTGTCAGVLDESPSHGQLCVQLRGKSACVDVP